jgi:hypothetical protein
MIQSGYHCFLLNPFQFVIQSHSIRKYNPTVHSVRQSVSSQNQTCANCVHLSKTGHFSLLRSWTRRQQDASFAMRCCGTLSDRQDTQPSKRRQAPNSTLLYCLQAPEESRELNDNAFETNRKQLELCALCFPLSTCLFASRTDKSTIDRHIKWP